MKFFLKFYLIYSTFLNAQTITGKAYVNKTLIYTEKHYPKTALNGLYDSLQTDYLDQENKKFASIQSNFNKDRFVPDSYFEDYRFGTKEEISYNPSTSVVTVKNESKTSKDTGSFKIVKNSVAGQGFHNFIIKHFSELLQNKKKISIIVPHKKDFYHFVIEKEQQESDVVYFKISPENFILKQLVTPIKLEYSISKKQLLRFYGLSNLEDNRGKSQIVDIRYEYIN